MVIIGIEANSVTATETSEAFATKEDSCTEEPDIVEANMAGYDPVELGATTIPRGSNSAASTKSRPRGLCRCSSSSSSSSSSSRLNVQVWWGARAKSAAPPQRVLLDG